MFACIQLGLGTGESLVVDDPNAFILICQVLVGIVPYLLRSPADAQFLAPLRMAAPNSPFERFAIKGAWVECDLKNREPS